MLITKNSEIKKTYQQTIAESFQVIEQKTQEVTHHNNKATLEAMNKISKELIDKQQNGLLWLGSSDPRSMMTEYLSLVTALLADANGVDTLEFSSKAKTKLIEVTNAEMKAQLGEALDKIIATQKETEILGRESISVKCLTFALYSVALNVITSLIPGVGPQVPGYAITLSALGAIANHVSTAYPTVNEGVSGGYRVADRVINNTKTTTVLNTMYRLTERVSLEVSGRVNQFLDAAPAEPGPDRPRLV